MVSPSIQKASGRKDLVAGLTSGGSGSAHTDAGFLRVPSAGGYTIYLLTSTTASLTVDGVTMHSRKAHAQVCGSPGDAVQAVQLSLVLAGGDHTIAISRGPEVENAEAAGGGPVLLWEGPGLPRQAVPAAALLHANSSQ